MDYLWRVYDLALRSVGDPNRPEYSLETKTVQTVALVLFPVVFILFVPRCAQWFDRRFARGAYVPRTTLHTLPRHIRVAIEGNETWWMNRYRLTDDVRAEVLNLAIEHRSHSIIMRLRRPVDITPIAVRTLLGIFDQPGVLRCLCSILHNTDTAHTREIVRVARECGMLGTLVTRVTSQRGLESANLLRHLWTVGDVRSCPRLDRIGRDHMSYVFRGNVAPTTGTVALACVLGGDRFRRLRLAAGVRPFYIQLNEWAQSPFILARVPSYPEPVRRGILALYLAHLRTRGAPGVEADPGTLGALPPELVWWIARYASTPDGWEEALVAAYE